MTHAELRASDPARSGLEPTSCPGEVEVVADLVDQAAGWCPGVLIYRCEACGHVIPVEAATGRVRNDYSPRWP